MATLDELLNGLEDEKANEIRASIEENYIGRNIAHEDKDIQSRIVGKTLGTFETKLKRNLKQVDEGIMTPAEIDELGFDKALDAAFERVSSRYKDLSEKAANSGKPDTEIKKKYEELQKKHETISTDYGQVLKQKTTLEEQLSQKDNEFATFKTQLFVDGKRREALKAVQFTDSLPDQVREYAMKGFLDAVNNKYTIEPSDDDESGIRIVDTSTGQRVAKDNKFLTLDEIYKDEANKAGLLKVSNGTGTGDNNKKRIFEPKITPKSREVNDLGFKRKS